MSRLVTGLAITTLALTPGSATAEPGVDHAHVPTGQRFHTSTESYASAPAVFDAGTTKADGSRASRLLLAHDTATGGGARESTDDGATWRDFPAGSVATAFRLPDAAGTVVTIGPDLRRWVLTGGGWAAAGEARVSLSRPVATARFGPAPLVTGNGKTVLATMTGDHQDGTQFAVVVASTDEGVTWTEVAPLATGAGWRAAHLAPTSDGGLIAVLRKDENLYRGVPANLALYTRKAPTQSGTGWGEPVRLSGETGHAPTVTLLGNGALVLASGRPDSVVRFSFDGKGDTWTSPVAVYRNYPRTGGGATGWYEPSPDVPPRLVRHVGSSGTVGVAPLSGNRVLAVGDNCATGCPAELTGYDVDTKNALWQSTVEADTSQWGKVDLTTLFQRGELSVVDPALVAYGDCAEEAAHCRESLAAYAFDGDARADSSLVTANRGVVLKLPRPMTVTAVGLHAYLQGATDVRIETSNDGVTWHIPTRGARNGILRPFVTPPTTRFLRITDLNRVTDPTAGFLHEIELYTTVAGFEHDYPGQAPRGNGWVTTSNATVVNQTSVPTAERISSRFLRIKDDSPTTVSRAAWAHAPTSTVTAEFRVRGGGNGLVFALKGKNGTALARPYGFWLTATGNLHWANYSVQPPWGTPLNSTPYDTGKWHTVKLVANLSQVRVYVDGALVATKPKSQAATAFDGLEITSNGAGSVGDDWQVDDVTYTS